MYYISRIRFRGFKSFKNAEVTLPGGFVALAGPNGSGKSNVLDAIRFGFGEMSLKSLRAKRVAELINQNSSKAEVVIHVDGERHFEIRRAINGEGKTAYYLDGRHLPRVQILDSLRPFGLEVGAHNIIAQGQVQHIVQMNARERRAIIDQVAGIAEFDDKKKEALGELDKVSHKVSESNIVMAERRAYLSDLEKERDAAVEYQEAQENLKRARATLLHAEYEKLEAHFSELLKKKKMAAEESGRLEAEQAVLSKRKGELSEQLRAISSKVGRGAERERLLAQIEEKKVALAGAQVRGEEKRKETERLEAQEKEARERMGRTEGAMTEMDRELQALASQMAAAKKELEAAKQAAGVGEEEPAAGEREMARKRERLSQARAGEAAAESARAKLEEMVSQYSGEAGRAEEEIRKLGKGGAADEQMERLGGTVGSLSKEMDKLFDDEKKLNKSIPDLDRRMLEAKERAAALRGSVSPASQNPALLLVQSLKKEGMHGIYGPVSDLISVDREHRIAVEAAAGGRLLYVVVDRLDTASAIIGKLKEAKAGRCTFIPLDTVRAGGEGGAVPAGALGRLIDFVDYDAVLEPAMRYLFEDTLLVESVATAKKIGTGQRRMVTLEGELMERSGTIAGGSMKGSLMARASLERAEKEVEETKAERDGMYGRLFELREQMQRLRRERADAELRLRALEAERGSASERAGRLQKAREEQERWLREAKKAEEEQERLVKEAARLREEAGRLARELEGEAARAEKERQQAKARSGAAQERYRAMLERHANSESLHKSKQHELEMLRAQKADLERQEKALGAGAKALEKEQDGLAGQEQAVREELDRLEAQMREVSSAAQKYYDQMKGLEKELETLGEQEGKMRFSIDARLREGMDTEVKMASVQTRLADVKAEWEKHAGVPLLEAARGQVEELIKKSEARLAELGNVNLKAPEMYEQRKKDIEEVAARVQVLERERQAVMALIDEIERKKRAIFMETFGQVNRHFGKLFAMVYPGEAALVLEEAEDPLQSGLQIRIRGQHDKRDRYLNAMSGGEMSLIALMFIFALQMHKPAPFYILDEAEAALDKENARKFADFIKQMSGRAQFLVVTHNDAVLSMADVVLGVTKNEGMSSIVGVQLTGGSPFLGGRMPPGEPPKEGNGTDGKAGTAGPAPPSAPAPGQRGVSGLENPAREVSQAEVVARKGEKVKNK